MQHLGKYIFPILIYSLPLQGLWYEVCIDPGHGGVDPGALGVNGATEPNESDFNLDIALVCYDDLINLGWSVLLTRNTDNYNFKLDSGERAAIANGLLPNIVGQRTDFPVSRAVSIHCNASNICPDTSKHYTETYYSAANLGGFFAQSVHDGAWNYLQMFPRAQNRGIKQRELWFLKECKMAAAYIEVAFVTDNAVPNGQWYQLLENQGGFKDYAAYGIDDGITGLWWIRKLPMYLRVLYPPWELLRGSVQLLWHPPTSGVTYSVYRREHPNPDFVLIASGISYNLYG